MRMMSTIERRLLVNWRADPEVVQPLLPSGLRPTIVAGSAVVGVCFVRLRDVRPRRVPMPGATIEGAAHRVGVDWDTPEGVVHGAYVWERHTESRLNALVGGRLFPGVQTLARFTRTTSDTGFTIDVDGVMDVEVRTDRSFRSEVFRDLDEASSFFECGPVGLSARRGRGLEAIRLGTDRWSVEPVEIVRARSAFFDDTTRFPTGSIELDCGLLMRDLPATWASEPVAASPATAGTRCSSA